MQNEGLKKKIENISAVNTAIDIEVDK